MKIRVLAGFAVCGALATSRALAHDQWIVVESTTRAAVMRLVVGEPPAFEEEKPFERAKLSTFAMRSSAGSIDLMGAGVEGEKPMAKVDALGAGAFLVSLERKAVLITLEAAKFESYLAEEHLDDVRRERARANESGSAGRERYTRHLKALVWMNGVHADSVATATLGHHLEIVLDADPAALSAPADLPMHVRFEGKPLPGAWIEASGAKTHTVTTGADGSAKLRLEAGAWVLHLVHMRRCASCRDADWESAWASYALSMR